jgi:hypothetical protein
MELACRERMILARGVPRMRTSLSSSVRALIRRHVWLVTGILALFTTARLPALTGWDDSFYIAQLTSAVADRDLLLQDDLLAFPRPVADRLRSITSILDSGALHNTFSVGFGVIHGTYAWPFIGSSEQRITENLRRLLALGSLVILILTALSCVRLCERWGFAPGVSRLGTGLALASGPLAIFGARVYLNSHLLSALLASVVVLGFIRLIEKDRMCDAVLTGLAGGFLVINRWQDAVLLTAFVPALVTSIRRSSNAGHVTLARVVVAATAFCAVTLLQLLAWQVQFSSWFLVPQGEGYMHWLSPALVPLLTSPYHGLVPWAPGLALGLAVAPFVKAAGETPNVQRVRRGFLLALPIFFYLSAVPTDWWGGDSYGPRRLATLVPIAALGLAGVLQRLRLGLQMVASVVLVLWASVTLSAYLSGVDDLWVLVRGTPGPYNPHPAPIYQGTRWTDSWRMFHALKPGFTFTDTPRNLDRLVGAASCATLVTLTTWCWLMLRASPISQRTILACILVWVAVCAIWLSFAIPKNDEWNRRWKAVVRRDREPPDLRPFPPRVRDAAYLIRACQALTAADEKLFQEYWRSIQNTAALGVSEQALRDHIHEEALTLADPCVFSR